MASPLPWTDWLATCHVTAAPLRTGQAGGPGRPTPTVEAIIGWTECTHHQSTKQACNI